MAAKRGPLPLLPSQQQGTFQLGCVQVLILKEFAFVVLWHVHYLRNGFLLLSGRLHSVLIILHSH